MIGFGDKTVHKMCPKKTDLVPLHIVCHFVYLLVWCVTSLTSIVQSYCDNIGGERLNSLCFKENLFVCLFDLILYIPSTIFQLNRDRSS